MKLTTLITSVALAGSAAAQGNFFIGGSYGFASNDPADAFDVFDNLYSPFFGFTPENNIDAINIEDFQSIEFGYKSPIDETLSFSLSAELLFSGASGSYRDSLIATSYDVDNFGILVNAKLSKEVASNLHIYAGLGLGSLTSDLTQTDSVFGRIQADETVFIWQITAGAEYMLTEQLGAFLQYRYLSGQDYEDLGFTAVDDSFFELGLRFHF